MQHELVDFSDCDARINNYDGAVFKHPIVYKGEVYLLKYGGSAEPLNADQASYIDFPLCEHLGSRCFETLGLPAQKTILGTYRGHKVVACKDFIQELGRTRFDLVEFKRLERSYVGWSRQILKTPQLANIHGVFDEFPALSKIANQAETFFWKMFLCDALLANFDRHAGNWGYIHDLETDELVSPAPVYDCGGCLTPRLTEDAMARIITSPSELRERTLAFPRACMLVDGKKPTYQEFFELPEAERCMRVARDFVPKMDISAATAVIEGSPGLSDVHREYLCKMIACRYETLLAPLGEGRR